MAFLKQIGSQTELDELLNRHKEGLVVVDFWANWCAPCHAIAPVYEKLSQTYRHVAFAKVDVDSLQGVAQKYGVTVMPMFLFFKNKQVVDQVKGANSRGLEDSVKKYAPPPPAGDSNSGSSSKDEPMAGDISLLEFLDNSQINCLNESMEHPIKPLFASKTRNNLGDTFLLSDADEQLLLNITFNQQVRVRSVILHSSNPAQGPKLIKLLVNKPALGFEDVEDVQEPAAAQVMEIPQETVANGKHIRLRYVRFQTVNSLHIFVASNQGSEDETRIDAIDIFGVPVEVTKPLTGLKKQEE